MLTDLDDGEDIQGEELEAILLYVENNRAAFMKGAAIWLSAAVSCTKEYFSFLVTTAFQG